jgi:dipeptidyl aminopeptidase/acylaminoacyl peptidase
MKRTLHLALASLVVLPLLAAAASSGKRGITEKDILKFRWVADPRIAPGGGEVAYVLVTVNEKEDRYDTSLWAVTTSGPSAPRRLTAGPRDVAPRWSPDGKTLAFLRAEEKGPAQIHLLPMTGGEARKLTDLPKGTSAPVWAPSGKTIAFTSTTSAEDFAERDAKKQGKDVPKKSDVHVVTKAVYRANGAGWLEPGRHQHIWTVPVAEGEGTAEAREITSGKFDETDPAWSRDGSKILFLSNRVEEPYYFPPDSNVYAVPAAGGETATVIDIDGPIRQPAASPDGARFVFAGFVNPRAVQSHTQSQLFLWENGKATPLTGGGQDFEIGSQVGGDQRAPRGGSSQPLVWSPDGRSVIAGITEHGRSNLARVDLAGKRLEPLTSGNHDVMAWTATPDASKLALTIGDATHIGDVYVLDAATKKVARLTSVNDELFGELNLTEPEEIWYVSFDGKKIHGWIQKPPDFAPGKTYPFILEIHGGPHAAYGWTFTHEFQWMAAKGYVVLYTNPRGSTSYGQEFANIIQYRYPGDDYKDLMAGVDEVVKLGYVDTKRMGVTGGSGGGLLTNWTVTQTNRFRAAVSQRSVAEWASFWYTADFTLFTPSWFQSIPVRDPKEFLERSPVRYADKIETPILFVEGGDDLRTPPGQGGEAMFRTLKALKKPTAMVNFPGETHELSRSGKPHHRVERLQHIVGWFDKYLQGVATDAYDLR